MSRKRVAILISGSGSNMVNLVESMGPDHPAEPAIVISNVATAPGLDKAAALGVPTAAVPHGGRSRTAFEADLSSHLDGLDLICLAGFMRILTPGFVTAWADRMLNIHPSLLPLFPGLDTHGRAIAAGMAVHGATVHVVTPDLDAGPILGQGVVPVHEGDTPEALAARLLPVEHRLYPQALRRFAAGDRARFALI